MLRDVEPLLASPRKARRADGARRDPLAGCPYCCEYCYDHYLEWWWRNAAVACSEVPRARQYVLGGGGGMTEEPGSVVTSAHALERSGTQLNQASVHRWQFVDGAARQRARRLLNALAFWALVLAPTLACWRLMANRGGGARRDAARRDE